MPLAPNRSAARFPAVRSTVWPETALPPLAVVTWPTLSDSECAVLMERAKKLMNG